MNINQVVAEKIDVMTFNELLIMIGVILGCILALLITIAVVLDILNVKTFSFTKGFTFYAPGDVKKTRITRRKKTVRRKV